MNTIKSIQDKVDYYAGQIRNIMEITPKRELNSLRKKAFFNPLIKTLKNLHPYLKS